MRNIVITLLILVLPAAMATVEVGESPIRAANPFALWRITAGMGAYYLLVLAVISVFVALAAILQTTHLWAFVRYMLEIGILTVFAVLGACVFLRRIEVGFEPRSSPERAMEREVGEHQLRIDEIIDQAYVQARLKEYERAASILKRWLSDTDEVSVSNDVKIILQRVRAGAIRLLSTSSKEPLALRSRR